jgi:hypothetical protein
MQATHYIPDEIEGKHGHRETPSLRYHTQFAEEAVGERRQLTQPQVFQQGHTHFHDLLVFTSDRPWVFVMWALEVFWLLYVMTACAMEMWGACSFDLGTASYCTYCYSNEFLTFLIVLIVLWTFNLYTYALLASRGFQLKLRYLGLTAARNSEKGIPKNPVHLFLTLSLAMMMWLVVGVIFLIGSESCHGGGNAKNSWGNRPGRSNLLFWTMVGSIIFTPILLFLGRCDDAKGFIRRLCY